MCHDDELFTFRKIFLWPVRDEINTGYLLTVQIEINILNLIPGFMYNHYSVIS